MNRKQIIRTLVFFLLLFVVLVILSDLFEYQNSNMSRRYEKYKVLEDDTVDAVYIGTSGVDRYWINAKAYEDYGMTVYPLSTEGLPPWLIKNLIVEAYKHQNPQLIIIDVRPFITGNFSRNINLTDVRCRRVIDMLDYFSTNRISAITRSKEVLGELDDSYHWYNPSFYFSFIRYHHKWSDDAFTFDDLDTEYAGYMGFYVAESKSIKTKAQGPSQYVDTAEALDDISKRYLDELVAYVKEEKINVLFVDSHTISSELESARRLTLQQYFADAGMDYLTYNTPEMEALYPIDHETDFYNSSHVNYYGAEKYTEYFAKYLDEHYDFPDHRNDEKCAEDWNGIYDKIKKRIAKFEKTKAKAK